MSVFTFEIVWHDEAPVIANALRLSDEPAIWCRAEALALRIENGDSAFIRVKNSEGATVVRTASPLRSPRLKSVHACPAPSKGSGSAASQPAHHAAKLTLPSDAIRTD